MIRWLITSGQDINQMNKNNQTPLMIAAKFGNINALSQLLASSADLELRDSEGKTALLYAADYEKYDATELLLQVGARCDMVTKGKLPWEIAPHGSETANLLKNTYEFKKHLVMNTTKTARICCILWQLWQEINPWGSTTIDRKRQAPYPAEYEQETKGYNRPQRKRPRIYYHR